MTNVENQNVLGAKSKVVKSAKKTATVPIRIRQSSKTVLDQLLRQANKDPIGKKAKADDIIAFSLSLVTEQNLAEIRGKTLLNKDRMELLFHRFVKEHKGATRDEFFGALLNGQMPK